METEIMLGYGKFGAAAAMACAAMGSALGTGAAGSSVIGVWKKCFAQSKAAPFILMTFVGAPLSQTIYGMILMNNVLNSIQTTPTLYPAMISAGIFGGIAMGLSAWAQGRAGAGAADALAETGKGFGNYLMVLGVIETVALFVMVFVGNAIK